MSLVLAFSMLSTAISGLKFWYLPFASVRQCKYVMDKAQIGADKWMGKRADLAKEHKTPDAREQLKQGFKDWTFRPICTGNNDQLRFLFRKAPRRSSWKISRGRLLPGCEICSALTAVAGSRIWLFNEQHEIRSQNACTHHCPKQTKYLLSGISRS